MRFNAAKGVVLATGDYQCNNEMIAYYCPDVLGYPPLEIGRDGDGHRMGVWAGGHVEPGGAHQDDPRHLDEQRPVPDGGSRTAPV